MSKFMTNLNTHKLVQLSMKNNANANVYSVVIMAKPLWKILSYNECQTAADSQAKPTDLGCYLPPLIITLRPKADAHSTIASQPWHSSKDVQLLPQAVAVVITTVHGSILSRCLSDMLPTGHCNLQWNMSQLQVPKQWPSWDSSPKINGAKYNKAVLRQGTTAWCGALVQKAST